MLQGMIPRVCKAVEEEIGLYRPFFPIIIVFIRYMDKLIYIGVF
jgi:hypothetical protein